MALRKLTYKKATCLHHLMQTLDRMDIMPRYLITVETRPTSYLNAFNDIEYEEPQTVYGLVIRIITDEYTKEHRVIICEEDI